MSGGVHGCRSNDVSQDPGAFEVITQLAGDLIGSADPDERGGQNLLDREARHTVRELTRCSFGVLGDLDVLHERFELGAPG